MNWFFLLVGVVKLFVKGYGYREENLLGVIIIIVSYIVLKN